MNSAAPSPLPWSRRGFLRLGAAAGAAAATARTAAAPTPVPPLIDTHVYLGPWPFRRVHGDTAPELVAHLRAHGVTEAWTGSLDALLHKDLGAVNAHLAEACARHGSGLLVPVGSVNPAHAGWEEELHRCARRHRMPGIRLHPNYHGYGLDAPAAGALLRRAADLGLFVQVALAMEDERTIHPRVNVPAVDPLPLLTHLDAHPGLRLQLLSAHRAVRGGLLLNLAARGAALDLSNLDGLESVAHLLRQLPPGRLCFGSYAPVFYFEASLLRLREADLDPAETEAVRYRNARRLATPS